MLSNSCGISATVIPRHQMPLLACNSAPLVSACYLAGGPIRLGTRTNRPTPVVNAIIWRAMEIVCGTPSIPEMFKAPYELRRSFGTSRSDVVGRTI
jgi:hypothetical protein